MATGELNPTRTIHIGTFRDSCASHGCSGCPEPESLDVREALAAIGRFVEENGNVITNALEVHSRRMAEGAGLATEQRQAGYAKVFGEESAKSSKVMSELAALLERLSESRQDQFVDSAD